MKFPVKSSQLITGLARQQLKTFLRYYPAALKSGDPEDIHQLRVASRRLQQYSDLLFPEPQEPALAALDRCLRRARRLCSVARNCDVVQAHLAAAPGIRGQAALEWWTMFDRYLAATRRSSLRRAARKLRGSGLRRALRALDAHLSGLAAQQAASPAGAEAEPRLRNLLAGAEKTFQRRLRQARRSHQTAALHRLRIAGKRLRYLIEVLLALRMAGAARLVRTLTRLQDALGELHDLVVMEDLLIAAAARPEVFKQHPEFGATLTRLLRTLRARQSRQQSRCWRLLERPAPWQLLRPRLAAPGSPKE